MFSVAVRSSMCRFRDKFGDGQLLWLRNMMSYVAGGQANFGWKYMFFDLLSTMKVNLVAKILQSAFLCVISHVKHKKLQFLAVSSWFLILITNPRWRPKWWPLLVTSQASSSATTLKIYFILLRRGFPLKVNWFQNTETYIKNSGRGSIHTPSPPLYHSGSMNSHARPRVWLDFHEKISIAPVTRSTLICSLSGVTRAAIYKFF